MVLPASSFVKTSALADGEFVADRYTVLREIGRGGMAAVYLCYDSASEESVALKVLFFEQPNAAAKYAVWFHQEARALAALDHPAIVHARDFGTLPDGAPYLVMDALEGRSLHSWKHLSPPPWEVTWTVMDQVLAGLAHAHARGIVHGDLKPSNVMVDPQNGTEEPRAYILDLGLAWLLADHLDPRLSGGEQEAPAMPLGGGTPGWLAPEQIRHATPHVGPATDLYALGCILYEMVSGKESFTGTPDEVLRAHRDTPVSPPRLHRGIPSGVADFVVKLLAKRPWHRYRFAADARAVWKTFRPETPARWNPAVPSASTRWGLSPPSAVASGTKATTRHLAPGIVALRPCPIVGREKERAALSSVIDAITRSEGSTHRLVVLEGDAGVGKSRLAEWVCEHVHEHALAVPLRARYRATPSPLDGLRGAILTHYNLVGQAREIIEQALLNEWEIGRNDDDGRTWVAATAAWLRPPAPDEPAEVGPAGKRFVLDKPELGRAIVRHALGRIAQGRPVVLWLDDVHLAPAATGEGLLYLHQDLSQLPMLLVATVRREAVAADAASAARVDALSRMFDTTRLPLLPMDEAQTRALLAATLPLTEEAEAIAVARCQGNPLFALQLVHAWAGGGFFTLQGGRYAVAEDALHGRAITTAELWEERIEEVPAEYRPVAYAAAALGADIPYDALAQLITSLGRSEGPALVALQKAQLLFPEHGGRFRWAHALLQEHLFSRLLDAPNAREIFRLAADALLFHPDAGTDRIVRHRAQNLLYAGEHAAAAETLFNFVAVAWGRVRDVAATRAAMAMLEGHVAGRQAGLLARWKGEVERHAGNLADARVLAERASKLFAQLDLDDDEAHALRLLAQIACDEGRPTAGRPFVEEAYAKFLSSGNDAGRAECEFVLGQIDSLLGNHEDAAVRLAHAAQGFRTGGESLALAQCILVQARAEMAAGRQTATQEMLASARAEFLELGYPIGLAQVDLALAQAAHNAGAHAEALERATATKARFEALGSVRGMTDSARLAAISAFDLGDMVTATSQANDAHALATQGRRDPWGQVEASCVLAQVALATGDLMAAARHLEDAESIPIDDAEPTQHRLLTAAWMHLIAKRTDIAVAAITAARRAFSDQRRAGDHTPQLVARLADIAKGTAAAIPLDAWRAALRSRMSSPPPAESTRPPDDSEDRLTIPTPEPH